MVESKSSQPNLVKRNCVNFAECKGGARRREPSMRNCSSCFRGNDVTNESPGVNFAVYTSSAVCLRNTRTVFYCCGSPNRSGTFSKRHGMYTGTGNDDNGLELAIEADENENFDVVKVVEPDVPYLDRLPVDLHLGRSIEILGRTLNNCNRFSINLSTGKENDSDLALHLNPRMDRRIVVRNHRIYNKWGCEEIVSVQPFPFKCGKSFSVLIFVADEQFMVTINKIHYCAFTFRIPIRNITHLIIAGDIALHLIHFSIRASYPPQIFSKTPYVILPRTADKLENKCEIRRKVNVIASGTRIEIFGRMKLLPRGFYINLQQGLAIWPHPLIPFHMNLRIHPPGTSKREQEIIFNNWIKGSWEKETIIPLCPFMPGMDFRIVIDCNPTCYLVEVNDKFFYKHQKVESIDVDTVFIYGDVIINKVVLRSINSVNYASRRLSKAF